MSDIEIDFDALDEAAVRAALSSPDPNHPVAVEIARRISRIVQSISLQIRGGRVGALRLMTPRSAIDRAATELALEALRTETGPELQVRYRA